jgi:hypothetical protein
VPAVFLSGLSECPVFLTISDHCRPEEQHIDVSLWF